jgi:hypothetical protein
MTAPVAAIPPALLLPVVGRAAEDPAEDPADLATDPD